ncbi:hypothetical protein TNCV_2483021 [Trichonephila clavipes]|uniref:Uncharacterized protein n=1 Tax=Trichonephila clavipes TaxID=2585209 RepID=A0A8X6VZM8_TRICX|nr:hypothetical protein TNCV_2483021 [Trichonephila clavipes]
MFQVFKNNRNFEKLKDHHLDLNTIESLSKILEQIDTKGVFDPCGLGSLMIKVTNSWRVYLEFQPRSAEDPQSDVSWVRSLVPLKIRPAEGSMHVKSFELQVLAKTWCGSLERGCFS